MASVISHAVAALGIGACFYRPGAPKRILAIGALCSVIPDLDVIGFHFGIRYADFWGHRGFTHSLLFAALLATAAATGFPQTHSRSQSLFTLDLFFLGHCKSRPARRNDRRRPGRSFLLALRQSPLLPSLDSDPRFPDRRHPFLHPSRPRRPPKRTRMDLDSRRAPRAHRLFPSPPNYHENLTSLFAFTQPL